MKKLAAALTLAWALPATAAHAQIVTWAQGSWSWFGDPRAVQVGGATFVGWIDWSGRVTVGEVAEGWLTSAGRLKATTNAARQSAWDHRVKPRWENVPIGDVRPSQVQEWVRDLVAGGGSDPPRSSRLW